METGFHQALNDGSIISIELEWTRFVLQWRPPGWYCAIKVTKKGQWTNTVRRRQSTMKL